MIPKTLPDLRPSQILSDDICATTVYPDIIVHIRGKERANLLVIEVKRYCDWDVVDDHDSAKLRGFTDQNGLFRYTWGVFLNFKVRGGFPHAKAIWFHDGKCMGKDNVILSKKKSPLSDD
jgi:hypothetical protein